MNIFIRSFSIKIAMFFFVGFSLKAQAGPLIIADTISPGCGSGNQVQLVIALNGVTHAFYNQNGASNGLKYHIDATPNFNLPFGQWASQGSFASVGNPAILMLPPNLAPGSSHTLLITTNPPPTSGASSSGFYNFTVPNCKKGMTWSLIATNMPTGTVRVGCGSGATACNPYHGDTSCSVALPLLCIRKTGPGFPIQRPASVNNSSFGNKWSGGLIGTTAPMPAPATLAAANTVCAAEFGPNWRIAEFHDGYGWSFQAYGGVGDSTSRFWTHINDQPNGNCW